MCILLFPQGTTYVYDSFFRPYVAKHENEIDRNLVELRTKAGDMAVLFCRKAVCYGQTRFTEILHFVALQSTPKPQPKVIYALTKVIVFMASLLILIRHYLTLGKEAASTKRGGDAATRS